MQKITRSKIRVILLSLLAYVSCYFFLYYYSGQGMSMSAIILVVALGWHYGMRWGICAGLLTAPVNILLASFLGLDWWNRLVINGAMIQGTVGCIFIGGFTGYVSGLSRELKKHRDNLTLLVNERTADLTRSNDLLRAREQELNATNMQLKAGEQQLIAAMHQLEASHEQLVAGSQEIKEAKEFLENIFDTAMDGIAISDETGHFIKVNRAIEKMSGYSDAELRGKHPVELTVDDELRKTAEEKILAGIEGGDSIENVENTWRRKDGATFPVEFNARYFKDDQGNITGSVGVIRDISERRQAEAEKQKFQEQLRQTQRMEEIGTLAGGIAHDFNNILGVIMGYSEMSLDHAEEGSPLRENLKEVLTAAGRAKGLVDQILTFSRQTDQELKPVKIKPILKDLLKFIRAFFPATIKIQSEIRAASDVVMADPTQIHQVMMNLCTNAKHAMHEKDGILDILLTEEILKPKEVIDHAGLTPGKYLRLKVSDNGCGMEPAVLKRIFDPFFTTKEQGKGTGLGLSVTHGIVKSCGGEIRVESKPGKGTEFLVYLPQVENRTRVFETPSPDQIEGGTERILVVDDEDVICHMIQKILGKLGYRVTARTSSVEALEVFRAMPEKFDLVLTDQTMPNLTGEELSIELFSIRPDIPVILCTGFSEYINKEKAITMGICDYVEKPVVRSHLAEKIRNVLDRSQAT